MTVREVYQKLVKARRPIDFFGDVNPDEVKKLYRKYGKIVHPDIARGDEKYIAEQAMSILNKLYSEAQKEYESGIYTITDTVDLYDMSTPLFEFEIDGTAHKFYEHFFRGEVADLYKGTNGEYIIFLKVATDPADNDLIDAEFKTLETLTHQSLPIVEKQIMVNDTSAIIMREVEGTPLPRLMEEYPKGVPAEHVMWMLERLFSIVGYLHYNKVVHGNIKAEHIIINKKNHNVSLLGFSLCITKADKPTAKYKVVNDIYTPPEVNSKAKVLPSADIYSVGKLAVLLLGGDANTNGMPISIDAKVRTFIRKLVNPNLSERPSDAWMLWDEVIKLRTDVFGADRFRTLE